MSTPIHSFKRGLKRNWRKRDKIIRKYSVKEYRRRLKQRSYDELGFIPFEKLEDCYPMRQFNKKTSRKPKRLLY